MNEGDKRWFAMRATYGRNMMAQRTLDAMSIESFIPMRQRQTKRGHRIKIDMVPTLRDLIFVFAERDVIQSQKAKISYLHYITRPIEGRNTPIEVPTAEMEQFIRLCENGGEVKSASESVDFALGEKVRFTQGSLKGVEGRLVKIQGKRSRRFTIQIDGVCAAVIDIKAEEIEKIER
ncbi:MAG: UpxY family transcription antiterminator [Alistipes sp.]|nr:UpxY family transcription antiterminator [Alistipes sp.]